MKKKIYFVIYFHVYIYIYIYTWKCYLYIYGSARVVMVTILRNGCSDTSSNLGRDCLHFLYNPSFR